jgi:hypothetical protein
MATTEHTGTAPLTPRPRPPRKPLPSPLAVITTALGLFFIVLTLMAIQVRNGRDPALGPGPLPGPASQPAVGNSNVNQATKVVTRSSPTKP